MGSLPASLRTKVIMSQKGLFPLQNLNDKPSKNHLAKLEVSAFLFEQDMKLTTLKIRASARSDTQM